MEAIPFITIGVFFIGIVLWFIEELFCWPFSIWHCIKFYFKNKKQKLSR